MSSSTIAPPQSNGKIPLYQKIFMGTASAMIVSVPLAMGVTVFDRSVIQFANGSTPSLGKALSAGFGSVLRSPITCFLGRDNLAVTVVYGLTYVTKNCADLTSAHYDYNPFWPVFLSSTFVNSSSGIMKDRYLAKLFGKGPTMFPYSSYSSFIARDCIIVGASFNGPPIVSPWLQREFELSKKVADVVAQLGCPACAQILGTPLHLMGLDFYNRPNVNFVTRVGDAIRNSINPIGARMVSVFKVNIDQRF